MGITLLSALTIQENDVNVETYQDKTSQKYGFTIYHRRFGRDRVLISASPIYDNPKDAKNEGDKLIKHVRETDLSKQVSDISKVLSG